MSNTSSGRSSLSDHAQSLIKVWKGSARQQTTVAGAIHKSSLTELSPAGCGKRIQSLLLVRNFDCSKDQLCIRGKGSLPSRFRLHLRQHHLRFFACVRRQWAASLASTCFDRCAGLSTPRTFSSPSTSSTTTTTSSCFLFHSNFSSSSSSRRTLVNTRIMATTTAATAAPTPTPTPTSGFKQESWSSCYPGCTSPTSTSATTGPLSDVDSACSTFAALYSCLKSVRYGITSTASTDNESYGQIG